MARCFCHEIDHLDGHLFTELTDHLYTQKELDEMMEAEEGKKALRILFMGTPEFAVPSLEALLTAGHQVCGVFTQPDKPKGRGGRMQYPPVKEMALEYGIPVFQPKKSVRRSA